MARKNDKENIVSRTNTIKKSNELSMSKLNQGLDLNQMQLLAYAIYSTQQDGKTTFRKHEFQKEFLIDEYRTDYADGDVEKLFDLSFSTVDLERNYFDYLRVFQRITYDDGVFTFKWTDDMIPHILELKSYSLTDLTIASKFKSGFSWVLYDYLKGHYGNWFKELSKEALMKLFNVESRVTYQNSTAQLKRTVLDVAVKEINEHTELDVWYTEKKTGNKITSFVLNWSTGNQLAGATEKQTQLLKEIHDEVDNNILDYLQMKNSDPAKPLIIRIKEINTEVKKGLSISKADKYIKESLESYKHLEHLLENDGKKRDTSIYYNWLEETDV